MPSAIFIIPSDALGGAEATLKKICRQLLIDGMDVDVFFITRHDTSSWSDLRNYKNISIYHLESSRELFGFPKCFMHLVKRRLFGKFKYDYSFTSHTHCNAFVSFCVYLKIISVSNIVLRESTNIFSWLSGLWLKIFHFLYFFYHRKALIICQTNTMKNQFIENVSWINQGNIFVLENPVEFDLLQILSEEKCEDKVDILAVGRLVREKAYDVLLQSFSEVLVKFPSRKLTIIGAGDQLDLIKCQISELKIEDSVFLIGSKSNPYKYMKKSNICVISSRLEGFPNVLYEMMSLSNAVVSTKCADGITDLGGVYTAEVDCVFSLKQAIIKAIEENEFTKKQNVVLMREKVKNLTVDNYLRQIFQILKTIN